MTIVRWSAVIAGALLLKIVIAGFAAQCCLPVHIRIAEGLTGVHSGLDGLGAGVVAALAFVAAFAASSALLASPAGRARAFSAAGATAVLYSAAAVWLYVGWVRRAAAELGYDPAVVATGGYVKYPPLLAAQLLQDSMHVFGGAVLAADCVMTLAIVLSALSTRGTASASRGTR